MNKINFPIPVGFPYGSKSKTEFFLEIADDYFYLGGKKAVVIPSKYLQRGRGVNLIEEKLSPLMTAAKVATYFTLIFPLILFIAKIILRSTHHFYLIPETTPLSKSKDDSISKPPLKSAPVAKETATPLTSLPSERESDAAVKIQKYWRGYLGRKKAKKAKSHVLSYPFFCEARPYIDGRLDLKKQPKALAGRSNVYLLEKVPIVVKQIENGKNTEDRFNQMQEAREIILSNQYQNLVIPKVRIYKNCLIEDKLPIERHDTKKQIGFYLENKNCFTKAVKEFAEFSFQSTLSDIAGDTIDPFAYLLGEEERSLAPLGRFDNVVPFIKEGVGKLGLVDLEFFTPRCQKGKQEAFLKCKDLICLFPLHFGEILTVAKRYEPAIEKDLEGLEKVREAALKRFKLAYEDHIAFIKEKKISIESPSALPIIEENRKEELKKKVVEAILQENGQRAAYNREENLERKMESFKKETFSEVFKHLMDFLAHVLNNHLIKNPPISTLRDLASHRTLLISPGVINMKLYEIGEILEKVEIKNDWIGEKAVEVIFSELERGKEIAYFNPSLGCGGHASWCVFL